MHPRNWGLVDAEIVAGALGLNQTKAYPPSGSPYCFSSKDCLLQRLRTPVRPRKTSTSVSRCYQPWMVLSETTSQRPTCSIPGLIDGTDTVSVSKEGYQTHSQQLTMKGDTRFDIQLVQR